METLTRLPTERQLDIYKDLNPANTDRKVVTFEKLSHSLAELRARFPARKIVHCHGVFDVLHAGHLAYFRSAKRLGDILVVTITTDRYVNKGPGRPYFPSHVRADMIAALGEVDFVALSDHPNAVPAIEALKPDFYVKGPDYRDKTKDVSGGIFVEEAAVERHGGKLKFTDDNTFSSSSLLNLFFTDWSEEQLKILATVRALGGADRIAEIFDQIARFKISVVGEPIVDTYRFCSPESISSKSPSISARFLYEENYAGGSLAIANHLADFAGETSLLITHGNEPYFRSLLGEKMDPRIAIHSVSLNNIPTPRKIRYIAADKLQRIFELTDLRSDQWKVNSPAAFCHELLNIARTADAVILADFGHGLFEGATLSACADINSFIALNVQTNSSNYGFNVFRKHRRFSYLSLDTMEARIAYHDRHSPAIDLGRRAVRELASSSAAVAMTLGPNGANFFAPGNEYAFFSPAFADRVVDATGAGDAFFGLTALLVKAQAPPAIIPFVGNVFAGLKAKIIGNKNPVSKAQLLKAITAILR